MTTLRTLPEPSWGWDTDVRTVEVERETRRGASYAVDRVYVNGEPVGFLVGRTEGPRGHRWWAHYAGQTMPHNAFPRLTYPTQSRQHGVDALVAEVKRTTGLPS